MLVPEKPHLGENVLRLGGERVDERHPYGTSFEKTTFSMRTHKHRTRRHGLSSRGGEYGCAPNYTVTGVNRAAPGTGVRRLVEKSVVVKSTTYGTGSSIVR